MVINMKFNKSVLTFLILSSLHVFTLSGCSGGETSLVKVAVLPIAPLVIYAPRTFCTGLGENRTCETFEAPNTQFKLEVDNKKGTLPVTLVATMFVITGPKGTGFSTVSTREAADGATDLPFLVEVAPGRSSSCMHKVTYLELSSVSDACPNDGLPNTYNPADTVEESGEYCCPEYEFNSLQYTSWIIGPIQTMTQEELISSATGGANFNFDATFMGWYGTADDPQSNFKASYQFNTSY